MTEEEAKTKWCPFARYVIDSTSVFPTGNRFEGQDGESPTAREAAKQCRCIASDCMGWREEKPEDTLRVGGFRLGFCGLAGSPSR